MKLLMIFTSSFAYTPITKTLSEFPDVESGKEYNNFLVAFIHGELHDEEDPKGVENKLLKNIKWAAKKNDTKKIILHSFAHLAETKADPHFTKDLFDRAEQRLHNADYECYQTPFGYFLDLNLKAPGVSQARIFKSF